MANAVRITEYPNYYITRDGRVWSGPRRNLIGRRLKGKWLKSNLGSHGYATVDLFKGGKRKTLLIHRLILEAYVGPCPDGMECRHLDGDPVNNNLENLCWGTSFENTRDAIKHGTHKPPPALRDRLNPNTKLIRQNVMEIRDLWSCGLFRQREIARLYGVAQATIWAVINNKTWKYI